MCAADGALARSAGDKTWDTLSSDLDLLRTALSNLRGSLGEFGQDFTMKDVKQIRREYRGNEATLQKKCFEFSMNADGKIAEVSRQAKRVIAMHSARISVE